MTQGSSSSGVTAALWTPRQAVPGISTVSTLSCLGAGTTVIRASHHTEETGLGGGGGGGQCDPGSTLTWSRTDQEGL